MYKKEELHKILSISNAKGFRRMESITSKEPNVVVIKEDTAAIYIKMNKIVEARKFIRALDIKSKDKGKDIFAASFFNVRAIVESPVLTRTSSSVTYGSMNKFSGDCVIRIFDIPPVKNTIRRRIIVEFTDDAGTTPSVKYIITYNLSDMIPDVKVELYHHYIGKSSVKPGR